MADQFIDRTFAREKSFYGPGFVAHLPMAHPVCPRLSGALTLAAREQKIGHDEGGTYICMEGPQFSTRAESELYRSWGCSVIGMTAMPEAKLAREAELPYAIIAMVTDYDCWHDDHDAVTVDAVMAVMKGNSANAQLIAATAAKLGPERQPSPLGVETMLDVAVMTAPDKRDPALMAKLDAVAGRILKRQGHQWISKTPSAPSRIIPSLGSCSATSPPCSAIRAPSAAPSMRWFSLMPASRVDKGGGTGSARLYPRRRGGAPAFDRLCA